MPTSKLARPSACAQLAARSLRCQELIRVTSGDPTVVCGPLIAEYRACAAEDRKRVAAEAEDRKRVAAET